MKVLRICAALLFTASNVYASLSLDDIQGVFQNASQLQSLAESIEAQASSAVGEIKSVFSGAATAVPGNLISRVGDFLPTKTEMSASGAAPTAGSRPELLYGMFGVAAGWYMANQ
jgi:ABC-type uncharacterized transport system permease subunit